MSFLILTFTSCPLYIRACIGKIFRQELGLISEAPYHQHGLGMIEYCCFIILLEPVKVGIVTEGCSVGDIPVARFRIIIDADIEFVPCLGGKIPI